MLVTSWNNSSNYRMQSAHLLTRTTPPGTDFAPSSNSPCMKCLTNSKALSDLPKQQRIMRCVIGIHILLSFTAVKTGDESETLANKAIASHFLTWGSPHHGNPITHPANYESRYVARVRRWLKYQSLGGFYTLGADAKVVTTPRLSSINKMESF